LPNSDDFFCKETDKELKIYCNYNWIPNNIIETVKLREKEAKDFTKTIEGKLEKHMMKYWSQDKIVERDLESRTVNEWICNEISFLAGFALWFREKENDGEIDLSSLISNAVGEDVSASGEINFDKERFKMLNELTSNTLTILKEMSPAGKIAYRSMDVAIIKGLSEGDGGYAIKMKERTLPNQKPWWKFW